MNDDRLKMLLQDADRRANLHPAMCGGDLAKAVRRRAHRRRVMRVGLSSVAAAVVFAAVGFWVVGGILDERNARQIARLEEKVADLTMQTEASQKFIAELVEREKQSMRLLELEAELASIPDPLVEIERQYDKAAFVLVYQADRLYKELNLKGSAVETYNRVIDLFPENKWAEVARTRLSEMSESGNSI